MIDFTVNSHKLNDYSTLLNQMGLIKLGIVDTEHENNSIWLTSLSLEVVSFIENLLPPISYRCLINYFLI